MAACVCIYLLNAALHHAGATAQGVDSCTAGLNKFKESGTSNPGACSACCFQNDGSFSHCCGGRAEAGIDNMCDGATAVNCVEVCNFPPCCNRNGCSNRGNSCCPYPGEFS